MRRACCWLGFWSALILAPSALGSAQEPSKTGRAAGEPVFVSIVRGPYLQRGTPTSVIVRWRTDFPATSRVRYGRQQGVWEGTVDDLSLVVDHEVLLEGLLPDTIYYYSVEALEILAQGPDYFFLTAPLSGKPTRIWVLGDSGTGNSAAASVRDAYYSFTGTRHTDLWLMLGDNAYGSGTDAEYQRGVYDMYPEMLRKSVLWSTIGNHDTDQSPNPGMDLPYFQTFTLPMGGEAGGLASGTEKYYSFDYGDIHFVCLDSMTSERVSNGEMCTWLEADLEMNTNLWVIAFFHHPPYTKGSHNSDVEPELIEMRTYVMPILESHSVDLVLAGHSHIYERSYLMEGHYGPSTSLEPEMVLDNGDGRPLGDGSYRKPVSASIPSRGTVYVVAGSSGQVGGRSGTHPIMYMSLTELGSLVLDVDGPRLQATFLLATGQVADWFAISKETTNHVPLRITRYTVDNGEASLSWNSIEGEYYSVQATTNELFKPWFFVSGAERATGPKSSRTVPLPTSDWTVFRIVNSNED